MLVLEFRAVDHGYFLDKLTLYEANLILSNLNHIDRSTWEQTRLHIYSVASMFSKNKLQLSDILEFAWDSDAETETNQPTITDIERLQQTAADLAQNIPLTI